MAGTVTAALVVCWLTVGCGLRDGREAADPPAGAVQGAIALPRNGEAMETTELGSGSTWLVLAHGVSSRRDIWYAAMDDWAAAGYTALAFDTANSDDRVGDLALAVDSARNRGAERVIVMGSSAGAAAAVELARSIEVDGVVAVSGGSTDPTGIDEPVLFVSSEDDDGEAARERAAAFGTEPVSVAGGIHGADLFAEHPEAIAAVTEWMATTAESDAVGAG